MPLFNYDFTSLAFNADGITGSAASGTSSRDWGDGAINSTALSGVGDNKIVNLSPLGGSFTTNYLRASNFRFDPSINDVISSGIPLSSISVQIYRYATPNANTNDNIGVADYSVKLIGSGGTLIGNDKAATGLWPINTTTLQVYDFTPASWGVDGASFLNQILHGSGAGVGLQVIDTDSDPMQATPNVDGIALEFIFTSGTTSKTGSIPLFIGGLASGNSSLPLFIDGGPHLSRCYGEFFPSSVSTICGSQDTGWANTGNLFSLDNVRATSTMTSGDARTCQLLSFFNISGINTQAQVSGLIFNFYKQQSPGDDSVIDEQVFLIQHGIVESGANYAGGIWGTDEHNPVAYTITMGQYGAPLLIGDITASGFGILMRAGTNNFGAGLAQIDTVTCTVCATVPGITNSIPLYLNVSANASGNLPLFIEGNTGISGSIPLYINGSTPISGSIPLFINGLLSNSGSIPLYLQSNSFGSGNIPLFIEGKNSQSGNLTLYLQGPPTFPANHNIPLYLGNFSSSGSLDSLRHTIPLFLDCHNFANGITLYLGVSNIGDSANSMTLYTQGAANSIAGNIPLFICNSGLTHSIPLYIKGLSYGTNPYINSDGYYPIEGGITLFITTGSEAASMPLYIGANFSASGNIPMFLAANNSVSSGIPLYMPAAQPTHKSFPLYHHGF